MPAYFADTSALLKRYVSEAGSAWIRSLDLSGLSVSALAPLEVRSALARRERQGSLLVPQVRTIWRGFRRGLRDWVVIQIDRGLLSGAVSLVARGAIDAPLRSLDALQLASALEFQRRARRAGVGPVVLLTANDRLEAAAARVGLVVENPNRHS